MCGISGVFGQKDASRAKEAVQRMNDALGHRGPDHAGLYDAPGVCLGHRRLSIIDLSTSANQPMHSDDGRWVLVFNGELYNYLEIKAQLKDQAFTTNSDTEVVLAAWKKWGVQALQRFNGMFAFAMWDTHNQELFLVRDRMGIKPLYVARTDEGLVFASEIRALLASGFVDRKMDQTALVDYLRYQTVQAPRTMLQGVELMLPGHYLHVQDTETTPKPYWAPDTHWGRAAVGQDVATIQKTIRQKLAESVALRMRADVPYGAFLSGGIDSSALVGLMAEVSDNPVHTFSVTFDERKFSEAEYSNLVAKKFATEHTEIRLQPQDFLDNLPTALAAMDHPSGDGPNTYTVSQVTKQAGVTMALSGLGGRRAFWRLSCVPAYARHTQ